MLKLEGISGGYGGALVLRDLSFQAEAGEVTCVMGRNGVGKTTLMRAIMGQVRVTKGAIQLGHLELSNLPAHEVPRQGVGYVPQGRRLFGPLTVAENLEIGLMTRSKGAATRDRVLQLFPRLQERMDQTASTLSGGEQQMLAIGRAMMSEPRLLLLDEPSMGLAPLVVAEIFETIKRLRDSGLAILLAEQNARLALKVSHRGYVIREGRIVLSADSQTLQSEQSVRDAYLGG